MADTSLRIGIDSAPAEAGARRVIASLRAIQQEAARAAGIKIAPAIDTSGIAEAVSQVQQALRGISGTNVDVNIPVGFDLAGIDRQTADIVRRVREEIDRNVGNGVSVEASLDVVTDAAEAEIDRVLSQSADPIETSLKVDTAAAEAEINRIIVDAAESVVIPVIVESAEAEADIDRLAGALDARIPKNPRVTVDADVSGVVAAADDAADALSGIGDAADLSKLDSGAKKAATSLSAIEAAAEKAGQAADNMSDAFKDATREMEAMELVGEALLAISTSIITAITAFEDFEDAVKAATGSAAAAEMAMAMLEEFALSTSVSIEDVTAAFVELRTNGLEASKESLTSYGNVAAGLNLTMEELAQAVGDAAERNFSKLNETQLKAKESGDKVIFTYHGVTTTVENTSKAIAGFIKTMGNTEFAGSMVDAAGGVTGAFEAMGDAWNELSRDMGEGGLSAGLEDFAQSMVRASEAADELGRILGGWLGDQASLLGRDIEGIVDQLNDLVGIFESVTAAINAIPSLSGVFDGAGDFMKRAVPALFAEGATPPAAPEQGPAENPTSVSARAFGSDTNQPRKSTRTARGGKSEAQRQSERFAAETANNKEMLRTLTLMDESYDRGRVSVEGFRNSIEELNIRQAAQKSVGKENAEVIVEQAMAMKYLEESMSFKAEVLDQQEAIMQTVDLAEAYKQGSAAVAEAEAKQKAYNTAVQLGGVNMPGFVDQLTELAAAAAVANDNLALEQDLSQMDQQIEAATKMGEAYKLGGAAIREAALEQEVYAAAVATGKEHDEEAIARIRDKMTALRDLTEARRADERAMEAGFDIEQSTAEIENLRLTGEEYLVASERLDMLMRKKRETQDATATLTPQEEALAVSLGKVAYEARLANDALSQLANDGRSTEMIFRDMAAQGLGHFEDALVDIVTGAKSAREAFANMAKSIAADLARMAVRMAIIQPLAMMFGGGFGGAVAAPVFGGFASSAAVGPITWAHSGGIVGADNLKTTNPFAGIPRFHNGGLAANETPAVLEKGEGVFTREQMKALAPANNNTTGLTVVNNINVTSPPGGDKAAAENQANNIARMVSAAVDERLVQAQRPGGILNANGGY